MLTLGKCIGGGLPIGAIAGREEVMALCGPNAGAGQQVRFDGGTFSALPATMAAGKCFLEYLNENEADIYPVLGALGNRVREGIEKIFKETGMKVICSGDGRPLTENSSLVGVHFLNCELGRLTSPDQAWNPEIVDFELREKIFKLAMIEEGVHTFHGFGGISAAHSKTDIEASLEAVERIAKKWSK
jgi:glutamate-1-semialdehyde 2,1-aminomutase